MVAVTALIDIGRQWDCSTISFFLKEIRQKCTPLYPVCIDRLSVTCQAGKLLYDFFVLNCIQNIIYILKVLFESKIKINISATVFLNGASNNVVVMKLTQKLLGPTITWSQWFMACIVPGIVYTILIPYILYKNYPPELKMASMDEGCWLWQIVKYK